MMNIRTLFTATSAPASAPTRRKALQIMALTGLVAASAGCSAAQGSNGENYPSSALEYVIPYNPGGSTDPLGREFSRLLTEELGTKATVMNMPGGDESIGITHLSAADPDGHTIGLASSAGLLAQPLLNDSLQYDGIANFTPVVKMSDTPYALLVAANSPYKTLDDLISAAKDNPGGIRIGTANRMGNSAFVVYELEDQAGIKMTVVPSTGGSGEAALAVMGGKIEAMVATASGQLGLVKSGDLRALAYTGTGYEEFLPEATSFEAAGFDIPFTADYMTLAPAGLPAGVQEKLIGAAVKVAESDGWADWSKSQGNLPDSVAGQDLVALMDKKKADIKAAIELANSREK
jgi:putative tricarboxylic transport membrane protein